MFVGASMQYLKRENMPLHEYVMQRAKQLEAIMPDYEIVSEHTASRVALMIRKDRKQYRYIDFPKFFELANSKGEAATEEYSAERMCPNR